MSRSRTQLEAWIKQLDVKATKCLDVGGSQLNVLGRLGGSQFVDYKILDLEKPHENSTPPDIALDLNRKYAMEEWAKYKGYFSVAFCLEVMEYCYNPLQALKNINYFMKKGAKLHISFHFYYPIHKPHGTDMLRYTEFGAYKLLEEAGFEVGKVDMKYPEVQSAALLEQYDAIEGNKRDGEYNRHYINGYLITATKT
jgi:hypothetical protein